MREGLSRGGAGTITLDLLFVVSTHDDQVSSFGVSAYQERGGLFEMKKRSIDSRSTLLVMEAISVF